MLLQHFVNPINIPKARHERRCLIDHPAALEEHHGQEHSVKGNRDDRRGKSGFVHPDLLRTVAERGTSRAPQGIDRQPGQTNQRRQQHQAIPRVKWPAAGQPTKQRHHQQRSHKQYSLRLRERLTRLRYESPECPACPRRRNGNQR